MGEKKMPDLEKDLNEAIQKALESGDFSQFKKMLGPTLQSVVQSTVRYGSQISKEITAAVNEAQKKQKVQPQPVPQQPYRQAPQPHPITRGPATRYASSHRGQPAVQPLQGAKAPKEKNPPSKGGTVFLILLGFLLGLGFLYLCYLRTMVFLDNPLHFPSLLSLLGFLALSIGSFWLAGHSVGRFRLRRFRLYQKVIASRPVCEIASLAAAVGKSARFVVRDIKKMIKDHWFSEGHLDDDNTLLILTDEAYGQYRTGLANRKLRELKEARIQEDPDGLDAVIAEGQNWIRQIREANDALPGQEISEKLAQLETVTGKIFSLVEQRPEKLPEIRRFMNYYLPTTVKLVKAYRDFESQPVQGENIQTAKQEIMDILDTVNLSFASLLDSLFQHDAMDISTDITVLKNMLAQEGLTEKAFAPSLEKEHNQSTKTEGF